jgi:hypothetical protein
MAQALAIAHHASRDYSTLNTATLEPIVDITPQPGHLYLCFQLIIPRDVLYNESPLNNPYSKQVLMPLGYFSLLEAQQAVLKESLHGPYRVETLAQPHIHLIAEPPTLAQMMAYLQSTAPGRYTLHTLRSIGRYQHCQIVRAQP